MIFNVRLCVETPEENRIGQYGDAWCFDKAQARAALKALSTWSGAGDPPGPWKKHVNSGRRGPGAGVAPKEARRAA